MSHLSPAATVDEVLEPLQRDGYAIIDHFLRPAEAAAKRTDLVSLLAQTPTGRNDFEGFRTQRIYALFAKTRAFDELATHPLILGVLDRILGSYQFSAPQGIQIGPGETRQDLHRDDGPYPVPRPRPELVVNTMWALDDFSAENGATHVVPGSHRWIDQVPDSDTPTEQAIMPAGSVMFFVGSTFHAGGANRTDAPRLGVILEYCAGWLRQQENQYLAVPKETARELSPRMQELLGYGMHNEFLGQVDARHPSKWLRS